MEQNNEPEKKQGLPLGKFILMIVGVYFFFWVLLGSLAGGDGVEGDRFIVHLKEEASLSMVDSTTLVKEIETESYSVKGLMVRVELVGRVVHIPINNISYVEVYKDYDSKGR